MEASRPKKFPDIFQLSKFYLFLKFGFKSYLLCTVFQDSSIPQGIPIFLNSGYTFTVSHHVQCFLGFPLIHHHSIRPPQIGTVFPIFLIPLVPRIKDFQLRELNIARKRCSSF